MQNHLKFYAKNKSILICDDDKILCKIIKDNLKDYFINIDIVQNGKEALDIYKNKSEVNKDYYSILITDIMMPKMNGIELINEIKKINNEQQIIVLSSTEDINYLIELIELGVDSFVHKPFKKDFLILKAYKILENKFYKKQIKEFEREQILNEYRVKNKLKVNTTSIATKKLETLKEIQNKEAIYIPQKDGLISAKMFLDELREKNSDSDILEYEIKNFITYLDDLEVIIHKVYSDFLDSQDLENISKIFNYLYNSIANIDRCHRLDDLCEVLADNSEFFKEFSNKDITTKQKEELEMLEFLLDDLKNFLQEVLIEESSKDINLYAKRVESNFDQLRYRLDEDKEEKDVLFL